MKKALPSRIACAARSTAGQLWAWLARSIGTNPAMSKAQTRTGSFRSSALYSTRTRGKRLRSDQNTAGESTLLL
jgi:hypothetical protein